MIFLNFLENLFIVFDTYQLPFVMMGDVNIDMNLENTATAELSDIRKSFGRTNTIAVPIRISSGCASLLDLCITNIHDTDFSTGFFFFSYISDHLPIFLLAFLPKKNRENKQNSFSYRKINEQTLSHFSVLIDSAD